MEQLAPDTELTPGDIVAPGATPGTPIRIRDRLTELPHGACYRARQDGVAVLVTVIDPVFVADLGVLAGLRRDLKAAAERPHRNLLPLHGFDRPEQHLLVVEHDPGCTTLRSFVEHRISRGRPLDAEAARTLVGHLCNALDALHPEVIHGSVTLDTTFVSESGRVFLSAQPLGRLISRTPGFARHRQAGRLPNVSPEMLLSEPQLCPGTDVFALGALFLEMVTGAPLLEAGQPIHTLGLVGPAGVLMCLERATAPSSTARPPDVASFHEELTEALLEGPLERHLAGSVPIPPPPDAGAPLPAPPPSRRPLRAAPPPPPPPPPPRAPPPPAPPDRPATPRGAPAPEPDPSASSSLLGLSLVDMDNIQLSTLDGVDTDERNLGDSIPAGDAPEPPPAPPLEPEAPGPGLNTSRQGPSYFIVRKGELLGPMPFSRISERAAAGELELDDRIQDRTNGLEHPVASVAALRRLLETVDERKDLLRFSQQRATPRTGPAPAAPPARPKDRRALFTLLWVVVTLAGFAAAGGWLMGR